MVISCLAGAGVARVAFFCGVGDKVGGGGDRFFPGSSREFEPLAGVPYDFRAFEPAVGYLPLFCLCAAREV